MQGMLRRERGRRPLTADSENYDSPSFLQLSVYFAPSARRERKPEDAGRTRARLDERVVDSQSMKSSSPGLSVLVASVDSRLR